MSNRKASITVPLGDDLLARVNTLAKARHQSAISLVKELLELKTKQHQKEIDEILVREAIIMEREKTEGHGENGQATIRPSAQPDAENSTAKNILNKKRQKGSGKT